MPNSRPCIFRAGSFPAYDERTLQVGGALLWRALAEAANTNEAKVALIYRKHGDLGAAAAEMLSSRKPRRTQPLTLTMVAESFRRIAQARGPAAKHALLRDLLARASSLEAKYLIKIMTGELRIGFKESLVEEAIAAAWSTPVEVVRRANMLLGDLAETLRLTAQGRAGQAQMRLFHPIGFMLATPAAERGGGLRAVSRDGSRGQVRRHPRAGALLRRMCPAVLAHDGQYHRFVPGADALTGGISRRCRARRRDSRLALRGRRRTGSRFSGTAKAARPQTSHASP